MTLLTTNNKTITTASEGQTVFNYDYLIQSENDMFVLVDDVQITSGFTVAGVGDPAGGTVTFDAGRTVGETVNLMRIVPLTQETDWHPYGPFQASITETAMDKVTMEVQQNNDVISNMLRSPIYDPNVDGSWPTYLPGAVVGWDYNSAKLTNYMPCECPEIFVNTRRRMYGRVNSDGTLDKAKPGITSARNSVGNYTISFPEPVDHAYVPVVSKAESFAGCTVATINEISTGFDVVANSTSGGGDPVDCAFSTIIRWNNGGGVYELPIVNPGLEMGDTTGWDHNAAGTPKVEQSSGNGSIQPHSGDWMLGSNAIGSGLWAVSSDLIDIVAAGVDAVDIDAGKVSVSIYWWQLAFAANNDKGRVSIQFYESDGTTESGPTVDGAFAVPLSWTLRSLSAVLPVNTRYIRIRPRSNSDNGEYPSAYFDDFSGSATVTP